ncbi:MAG: hypothetical protein JKP98_12055 [Rhodobacteraceae bacterium]|nr:hypothetical protein [Paracoccaceae bacterium]MBL4557539.1 hypothetical protein [Paracoccaceae bacterium]HBH00028.1 hypothetical protein [Paracoccaceae bacterium]
MTARFLPFLLCLALAGCGWFNWGQSEQVLIRSEDGGAGSPNQLVVADPRPRMPQVLGIQLDRTPYGAILTARGLPPRQGWWNAALVRVPDSQTPPGSIAYVFKAVPDPVPQPAGTQRSREVFAAARVPLADLTGANSVIVVAGQNQLSTRP